MWLVNWKIFSKGFPLSKRVYTLMLKLCNHYYYFSASNHITYTINGLWLINTFSVYKSLKDFYTQRLTCRYTQNLYTVFIICGVQFQTLMHYIISCYATIEKNSKRTDRVFRSSTQWHLPANLRLRNTKNSTCRFFPIQLRYLFTIQLCYIYFCFFR